MLQYIDNIMANIKIKIRKQLIINCITDSICTQGGSTFIKINYYFNCLCNGFKHTQTQAY